MIKIKEEDKIKRRMTVSKSKMIPLKFFVCSEQRAAEAEKQDKNWWNDGQSDIFSVIGQTYSIDNLWLSGRSSVQLFFLHLTKVKVPVLSYAEGLPDNKGNLGLPGASLPETKNRSQRRPYLRSHQHFQPHGLTWSTVWPEVAASVAKMITGAILTDVLVQ